VIEDALREEVAILTLGFVEFTHNPVAGFASLICGRTHAHILVSEVAIDAVVEELANFTVGTRDG
jgi:hypothetical protein